MYCRKVNTPHKWRSSQNGHFVKYLTDWGQAGRENKYFPESQMALGEDACTSQHSVHTYWPQAMYIPIWPSHSVVIEIFNIVITCTVSFFSWSRLLSYSSGTIMAVLFMDGILFVEWMRHGFSKWVLTIHLVAVISHSTMY